VNGADHSPRQAADARCSELADTPRRSSTILHKIWKMSWKQVEATLRLTVPSKEKTSERLNAPPPPTLESGERRVQDLGLQRGRVDEDSNECVKFPPLEAFSKVPKIPFLGSSVTDLKAHRPTDIDESFEAFAFRFNSNRDNFVFY
jgi:hypothetical protein